MPNNSLPLVICACFEKYAYLDNFFSFFQYKLQARILEEALATPKVEPARWRFFSCALIRDALFTELTGHLLS